MLPVIKVVIAIEIELLVLGLIFPEGGVVDSFEGFGLVLKALNDVILLLEQHVELLKLLVDGEQVGPEH